MAVNPKVSSYAQVQTPEISNPSRERLGRAGLAVGALLVIAVLIWQGVAAAGSPDPTKAGLSPLSMVVSSAVLVLREGLEAVLVLATITAGLVLNKKSYWRAVMGGVVAGLAATILTWFGVVKAISSVNAPEYDIQAGTELLAVIVLLVIMNWFFHKIYWAGWIGNHNKRKRKLLDGASSTLERTTMLGFATLGFTAIYREGFEIVLFLQDLRLKAGSGVVLGGASFGLALTLIVAVLAFMAHKKLPYKRMLILTGVLLAGVLIVMIGESAQEMQQAHWLPTTNLHLNIPDWAGVWFAIFPTVQTLTAQAIAVLLVGGSFLWIRLQVLRDMMKAAKAR